MPRFSYRGRDAKGMAVEGLVEIANADAVADLLAGMSVTPIDIRPAGGIAARERFTLFSPKIELDDVMLFSHQMYTLLKAGVPILNALSGLQQSTRNRALAKVIAEIREALDRGHELSDALRRHPKVFSPFYVSMIRVGEMTGTLDEIFLRMFHQLEFEKETKEQVRAALRYPSFVLIAMALALTIINLFVIPAFAKVYAGFRVQLPLMTLILIGVSAFFVRWWPLVLALAVGAALFFRGWVSTSGGKYQWDALKLRLPVVGPILFRISLAKFSRSFALASRSGVPIIDGFTAVAQVMDNDYMSKHVLTMRDGLQRGESISRTAAEAGIFTPVVLQMISVGEETGELDSMMQEVAEYYEREINYSLKSLSEKIEPILIVGLAIPVLILALGVFLPIWDLGRVMLHR
ncbi:MAG TPA: type II secretion system F family protein [Burkholderiales bacterium]|nr:type II secretion system F family protein [Burkholderiales bacterium]